MKHRTCAARQEKSHLAACSQRRGPLAICPGYARCAVILALAVWFTYRGPLDGPFIFDDIPTVVSNLSLRQLWPLVNLGEGLGPLQPPPQTSVSGRPVANLSLAVDFHFSKLAPCGYRITNIAPHMCSRRSFWR